MRKVWYVLGVVGLACVTVAVAGSREGSLPISVSTQAINAIGWQRIQVTNTGDSPITIKDIQINANPDCTQYVDPFLGVGDHVDVSVPSRRGMVNLIEASTVPDLSHDLWLSSGSNVIADPNGQYSANVCTTNTMPCETMKLKLDYAPVVLKLGESFTRQSSCGTSLILKADITTDQGSEEFTWPAQ